MDNNNTIITANPRTIELYHLVIAVLLCVGSMVTTWIDVKTDIEILKTQRKADDEQTAATNLKTNLVLERILENQTKILVEIEKNKR